MYNKHISIEMDTNRIQQTRCWAYIFFFQNSMFPFSSKGPCPPSLTWQRLRRNWCDSHTPFYHQQRWRIITAMSSWETINHALDSGRRVLVEQAYPLEW